MIRRGDEGILWWMEEFVQQICLLSHHMEPSNSENACENAHRKQIQPHKSKWKFQFVLFFSQSGSNTQEDLPSVKSFCAWIRFWERRGGPQMGDLVPTFSRFRQAGWTKMHLWQCWQNGQRPLPDAELGSLWGSACAGSSIKPALSLYLETQTLLVWKRVLHPAAGKRLCVESNRFSLGSAWL